MAPRKRTGDTVGYPIGVVARLTSIHPETLRIWERRYRIVSPARTGRGRRLYSQEDVRRLALIKALVDGGHPISSVARLSVEELQARIEATAPRASAAPARPAGPCRVLVVGDTLPTRLAAGEPALRELEIVGAFHDTAELERQARALPAEVLLLEHATVHPETLAELRRRLASSGARCAVLIYGFGTRQALRELEAAGVLCVRAPASLVQIQRACLTACGLPAAPSPLQLPSAESVPPRRYGAEQLTRIAAAPSSVRCECPRHLVDLINGLGAFETYSRECSSRNAADAELHASLYAAAGTARALLETALERVIAHDGVAVE